MWTQLEAVIWTPPAVTLALWNSHSSTGTGSRRTLDMPIARNSSAMRRAAACAASRGGTLRTA